jgi:hypothetical protein
MTVQADFEKLGGVVTKVAVTVEKKVSDGNYGSNGASLVLEVNVAKGVDLDALCDALDAYGKAYVARSLGAAVEQVRRASENVGQTPPELMNITIVPSATLPPAPETTKKDEPPGEVAHVAIKKFKLTAEPNEKYLLLLYPDIKGKPGEFPELKYTAARDDMWLMLKSVWDEEWKAPLEKEIDWVAEYQLGREYVVSKGKNAGQTKRYKDLRGLHTA